MASLSNVQFDIEPNATDINRVNLKIEYDVTFDNFDVATNLRYRQLCNLVGIDSANDTAAAGPDDILQTFFLESVSADSVSVRHQSGVFTVPRAALNEDQGSIPNPDELRMRVRIEPVLPANQSANSNIRTVTIT